MPTMRSAPSLVGSMRLSPLYQTLGIGATETIFLIGHADGLPLNDPYQVSSIQDVVNRMGADADCPLLRALLEAYYSGARDIFLVAAAPMSEYVHELADRSTVVEGKTFWQRYQERLDVTYALLLQWDLPKFIVPVEASLTGTGGVDFLTPLAEHCDTAFGITGAIRLGLLGSKGKLDDAVAQEVLADDRLSSLGDAGRFVAVLLGEALLLIQELPTTYATPVVSAVAGELSNLKLDRGLTYHRLRLRTRQWHQWSLISRAGVV